MDGCDEEKMIRRQLTLLDPPALGIYFVNMLPTREWWMRCVVTPSHRYQTSASLQHLICQSVWVAMGIMICNIIECNRAMVGGCGSGGGRSPDLQTMRWREGECWSGSGRWMRLKLPAIFASKCHVRQLFSESQNLKFPFNRLPPTANQTKKWKMASGLCELSVISLV